jgi:serine/threonine-protein kinase
MAKAKLTRLGRYKIVGEIGRGAMGVVYQALDPALDRTVALKTIQLAQDASGRGEYEARFFQEAKAAGKLSHPAIITIYDFGEEADLAYMAMELLEGTELRAAMTDGAISVRQAVDIASQVADGLGYAHERGVVHRDIKPSNVMLVPRGRVKILDFGIARIRVSDLKTQTGTRLGTPKYMSPEQVAGRPVDHRTDVFSLGIVLYEMLTRSALFYGSDTTQVLYNVANMRQMAPSRVNPEVPTMLDLVVARALDKDPEARYQDAYEFAADLRACLSELGSYREADDAEIERTVKLDPPDAEAVEEITDTIRLAVRTDPAARAMPAAGAIRSDTRLPLALRFDCAAALERLSAPGGRDRRLLGRAPRPAGFLRRLRRDRAQRRLVVAVLLSICLGAALALA